MRAIVCATVLCAGCVGDVGPCTPAPMWTFAVPSTFIPPTDQLAFAADGSIVLSYPGQLQHISGDDGHLIATAMYFSNGEGAAFAIDNAGAPVLGMCVAGGTGIVIAYDATLAMQWMLTTPDCPAQIARAANGNIAYSGGGKVYLLGPTGTQLWVADALGAGMMRFTTTGDVDAYAFIGNTAAHRVRLAAADGAVIGDATLPLSGSGWMIDRDGGFVVDVFDRLNSIGLARYDASGTQLWTRAMHTLVGSPAIASNDDVVAPSAIGTQVVRFAGATGAPIATVAHCTQDQRIIGATSGSYLVLGQGVIASYAGP